MDIQDSSIPKPLPEVHKEGISQGVGTDKASHDSSNTMREVHEEGSSKGIATDKASQEGRNTSRGNKEIPQKGSSEGTTTDKTSHDDHRATREVREEWSLEGMAADKASPYDLETTREVRINVSSRDLAPTEVSQDGCKTIGDKINGSKDAAPAEDVSSEDMTIDDSNHKTTREVHKEGNFEGMASDKASKESCKTTTEVHEVGSSEGMETLLEDFQRWLKQKSTIPKSKVLPRAVVNEDYRSLFEAAVKGDWKEIEKILDVNHTAMTVNVMTTESEHFTMLDVAIMAAQDQLVERLVKPFPPNCEDLNPTKALRYAARAGRIRMVKALVDKVDAESTIIDDALEFAVRCANNKKEVIWYLAKRLTSFQPERIMGHLILAGHLDICLYLARKYPDSMTFGEFGGVSYLQFLAILTHHFRSGATLNFWEKSIYKFIPRCLVDTSFDDSKDTKMARALDRFKILLWNLATISVPFIRRSKELKFMHNCSLDLAKLALIERKKDMNTIEMLEFLLTSRVVLDAASRGVSEIVELCLKHYPELMWDTDFANELIKEIVKGRHVELFRLVNAHNLISYLADEDFSAEISLMEAVTNWPPRCVPLDVSGAAFLMQRELQWFQVVEVSSYPSSKRMKFQVHRRTYWEVFVEQCKKLHEEAGQWMKDTSSSCSVVATLIITVAFAAAFTMPGGNNSNTGIPIFFMNSSFMVFVVADALALLCSITATLMFLAILTSRYAMEDFLLSLPRKMILGLTFLFLSLVSMLVAFGSALTIILSERLKWIYIPITLLAAFPIVLFAILQLPLYIEMVESTHWPRIYRPRKLWK